jgi:hypothetical protein
MKLPGLVFAGVLAAVAMADVEDDCFGLTSSTACQASPLCSWCVSSAVKSACHSTENAAALPASIFACSAGLEEGFYDDYFKFDAELNGSGSAVDCGGGGSFLNFDSLVVTPSSIVKGSPASLTASGTLIKPLTSGTYNIDVQYAGSSLYSHAGNVCVDEKVTLPLNVGTISLKGLGCPTNPGPANYGLSVTLPTVAPSGSYAIKITSKDQDSGNLFCVLVNLTL